MPKYKQEALDLTKLVGQKDIKIPIIFEDDVVPITSCPRYGKYGGKKIKSRKCILTEVRRGFYTNATEIIVSYDKTFDRDILNIPDAMPVSKLTGITGIKMVKEYDEYIKYHFRSKLNHGCSIGTDPEIFVTDKDNNIMPAFTFLGSKTDTNVITYSGNRVYWDGFQAEFETAPTGCLDSQTHYIAEGLYATLQAARKINPDAKLSINTVMQISEDLLNSTKDEHVALGCMPSLNAYHMSGESVENGRQLSVRSAGGHIHFGIPNLSKEKYVDIVKSLDGVLGVACVSLFENYDNAARRRYYGLAGEYRLPKHGLEYRSLSNAWLAHPFITNIVFMLARKAMALGRKGLYTKVWNATEEETIQCINTHDVAKAREILKRNERSFKELLQASINTIDSGLQNGEILYKVFMEGMHNVVKNPDDISGNWNIDKRFDYFNQEHREKKQAKYYLAKPFLIKGDKVA